MTRAERTGAVVAHGGALRLLSFLGVSAVVHGLLAVALLREAPPKAAPMPRASASEQAVVWFESPASAPSGPMAPAASEPPTPVRRAPVASRAVRANPPAALKAKPPLAQPLPPTGPTEEDPGSRSAAEQPGPGESAPGPTGVGAVSPEGVAGGAAAPGAVGSPGAGSGGTVGRVDLDALGAYARKLYQVVGRQRRYPASAARFGMEGTARIQLTLRRDGSVVSAQLMRSSGHEVLDAEALRMVEAAAPFAPLPEGHPHLSAVFLVPVDFSLRARN
jgi:protein TonB